MLNTPLETTDISNSIIISNFGFSKNIYNFLKVYPDMFNLNIDINLGINFNKKFPQGVQHSLFNIKQITILKTDFSIPSPIPTFNPDLHYLTRAAEITVNTEYYLRIPIINSSKNKMLYISVLPRSYFTYILGNIPELFIFVDSNLIPIKMQYINSYIANITNRFNIYNKIVFYIPKEYINDNFINIRFNLKTHSGYTDNPLYISDISTFDEFF